MTQRKSPSSLRFGFLLAMLVFALVATRLATAAEPRWYLAVGAATAVPGGFAEIPIELHCGGASLAAIAFAVEWDAERLILDSDPALGSKVEVPLPSEFTASSRTSATPGSLGIVVYDAAIPIQTLPEGTIARLRFRAVPGSSGFAPVRISASPPPSASGPSGREVPAGSNTEGGISIAAARARLSVSHSVLHFGSVPLGQKATRSLVVINAGTAPLTIQSASILGGSAFTVTAALPTLVNPGGSIPLEIAFQSNQRGELSDRLRIVSLEAGNVEVDLVAAATGGELFFERRVLVPAIARSPGTGGSLWVSTLRLHNPSDLPAGARLTVLDQAGFAGDPVEVLLGPGETRSWSDVAKELFGLDSVVGGLLLEASSGDIVVRSTTDNLLPDGGRIGQAVPALEIERLFHTGETAYLLGVEGSAALRSNVTLVNAADRPVTLRVESFLADGTRAGSRDFTLPARQVKGHVEVPGEAAVEGAARTLSIQALTPNATFFAYASTVDAITGAPVFQSAR